ncbi:methionine aminotransferase [Candidatus Oscillochloris fontis]|uniref:methionine aminotransferase n=1 Tax=Candidatus Oscillochloris fontis TaxID=2496868 RepID=UPI00101CB280|nr:methionine aminotransferase [Candidatus Oscillochloris fontis]
MSTIHAAERVRSFGTSIFAEVSALATQHAAVNLGQGFPDFAGPEWLKVAAIEAIDADLNQYAPYLGLPRLREAIAATWQANGWRAVDPHHEVTITSGATEALFAATQALINPGDEVIIFEPFYDAYVPDVVMAGGVPRYVRMRPPHADGPQTWYVDPAELAAAFSPRTRLLFLNSPHNPTGKVFTRAELEQIAALCIEHEVLVIADEVYDQIIFEPCQHIPIATLPGMWERTLTINSTGKTFSLTGWKIGYVVAAPELSAALRAAHQWITFATATPLQAAVAVGLERAAGRGYYEQLRVEYVERREVLRQVLHDVGLPPLPVEGSYFMLADISQTPLGNDRDFCRWLTSEVGVAAIPLSAFYANDQDLPLLVRFCFAKKLETLRAAAGRLEVMNH